MDAYHSIEKYLKRVRSRPTCQCADRGFRVLADFVNELSDPLLLEHYLEQRANDNLDIDGLLKLKKELEV